MVSYLLRMMTSWAIVCNVWYLPPMAQKVRAQAVMYHDVDVTDYALTDSFPVRTGRRGCCAVCQQSEITIAQQGGLVDLAWCVKEFVCSCPANA